MAGFKESKQIYIDRSPITIADQITEPLILIHGVCDTAVPSKDTVFLGKKVKGPVELHLLDGLLIESILNYY